MWVGSNGYHSSNHQTPFPGPFPSTLPNPQNQISSPGSAGIVQSRILCSNSNFIGQDHGGQKFLLFPLLSNILLFLLRSLKREREENYVISHFLFPKSIWNTTKMPSKALCCAGKRDWQSEISLKLERWALRRFKGHSSKSATAVVVVVGSK